MRVYFSPSEDCRNAIIREIKNATSELKICVFTISDDKIASAIIEAHQRDVRVTIITDNDKSSDVGSDIRSFFEKGIHVKMDMSTNHMHHKFMVADGKTTITGSYNWTNSAARYNQENIIVTKDQAVANSFIKEYDRLWQIMEDYSR